MHDATKQLNALAGDHKESPLGEHEIALRGSRSADQSGRIKCEERPVACIIQVPAIFSVRPSASRAGSLLSSPAFFFASPFTSWSLPSSCCRMLFGIFRP